MSYKKKTRSMRVNNDFYAKLDLISKKRGIPKTEITRQFAKEIDLSIFENPIRGLVVRRRKK